MRIKILWAFLAVVVMLVLGIAPNGLWLSRSSTIAHNVGAQTLTLRLGLVDEATDRVIDLGELAPGAYRFMWIDPVGEATLVVEVQDGGTWQRHCADYVEDGMFRVEITARSPEDMTCSTDLPLLDRLLLIDLLS
jgi:hypothetical protein